MTDVTRDKPDPGLGAAGERGLWPCPALPASLEGAGRRGSGFDPIATEQPPCKGISSFPLGTVLWYLCVAKPNQLKARVCM